MSDRVRDLFDLCCPKCGSDHDLRLVISTWAFLTSDGTEPFGDHEWDAQSLMWCKTCRFEGRVGDFHLAAAAHPFLTSKGEVDA